MIARPTTPYNIYINILNAKAPLGMCNNINNAVHS